MKKEERHDGLGQCLRTKSIPLTHNYTRESRTGPRDPDVRVQQEEHG